MITLRKEVIRAICNGPDYASGPFRFKVFSMIKWDKRLDDHLMQCMEEGLSFTRAAKRLGLSPAQCSSRFKRLREAMGWQAV